MVRKFTGEVGAGRGAGFELSAGSVLRIINTFGSQVVATWAFPLPATGEHMSMEHTRIHAQSSRPQPGTVFYTKRHRPILEMTSDSSPRVHDWYLAACNQQRYEFWDMRETMRIARTISSAFWRPMTFQLISAHVR